MSAPADATELRRVVWRHEYGYLSFDLARASGLDDEYRHALNAQDALSGDEATLREHAPALLREYDDARRAAERALYVEPSLRAGLHHLLRCRERMAQMRQVLEAAAVLRRAAEAHGRLWSAARVPRLRALPCVDAPGQLLAAARARMRDGCWARAACLAEAALRQATALDSPGAADPARAAALRQALAEMRALCAATQGLLPDSAADVGRDGTLEAAEVLVDDGLLALAGRVTEELGALLAPRRRFHDALKEEGGDPATRLAELRAGPGGAADGDPWTAAAARLRRARTRWRAAPDSSGADRPEMPPRAGAGNIIINHETRDEQPDL